ncbi:unnamed protein product, partial [Symbiodinium pilosum]
MTDDGVAYFVPYAADHIGVFDTKTDDFRKIDVSDSSSSDYKYSNAIYLAGIAYFIPSSANNI